MLQEECSASRMLEYRGVQNVTIRIALRYFRWRLLLNTTRNSSPEGDAHVGLGAWGGL